MSIATGHAYSHHTYHISTLLSMITSSIELIDMVVMETEVTCINLLLSIHFGRVSHFSDVNKVMPPYVF